MDATQLMGSVFAFDLLRRLKSNFEQRLQIIKRTTEYLQELDEAPVEYDEIRKRFINVVTSGLMQVASKTEFHDVTIPFMIELLRLKMLPDNTLSYLSLTNITAYYAVYRVVTGDYTSLKLEELHYIPHKRLLEVQAISPVREIQWQIARHF